MKTQTKKLVLTATLTALAFALSFTRLFDMPMGGSVTLGSMLPVMLVSLTLGIKWGLASGGVYALFQLLQALMQGNVFPYCETWDALVICILFDYVLPFTVLGLAGMIRNLRIGKFRHFGAYAGITAVILFRFLCHFVTGVVIWRQWAPNGMGKYLYSLGYNGGYMAPELGITLLLAVLLLESPSVRRIIALPVDTAKKESPTDN